MKAVLFTLNRTEFIGGSNLIVGRNYYEQDQEQIFTSNTQSVLYE